MSLCRLRKTVPLRLLKSRKFSSTVLNEDEYTSSPQYPPILDLSYKKKLERKKSKYHEEIKAVKTIEEKQIKLNMPAYYGFKCHMLTDDYIPYNTLPLVQHVTRTHLIVNDKLPSYYDSVSIDDITRIQADIEEAVLVEIDGYQQLHDLKKEEMSAHELENLISCSISKQINRIILNNLSKKITHLQKAQVDLNPRIESFWYAGGMNPPKKIKKAKEGVDWLKEMANDPTDRAIFYTGTPNLTLRADLPLKPLVSQSEAENPELDVPVFEYDPRVVGTKTEFRHIANIPGFWPGDTNQFGILTYQHRGHFLERSRFNDPEDHKESLHRHGILTSFGWLNAQANFLGFNTFNDITYPLVTQTVITNGKTWSFYSYQLNTLLVHSDNVKNNPKRNICFATPEMDLYKEIQNNKLIGFNEEILKNLVKYYANVPEARLGVNLRPYLSHEEMVCAEYEDDEKREWLEREYKFLMSNRPREKLIPEIYLWEKIYKIDNETRFMEKRRRPFELKINPFKRRLDDKSPRYIPRALRPDLPRHKGRYAKDFFP